MAYSYKRRTGIRAITTEQITPIKLPPLGDDQVRILSDVTEPADRYEEVKRQFKLEEFHFKRAYKIARRASMAARWKLFEALQYARASVIEQYGPDSPEVRSLEAKYEHIFRKPTRLRSSPGGKKGNSRQH